MVSRAAALCGITSRTYRHRLFTPRKIIKGLTYVEVVPFKPWVRYARHKIPNLFWQRYAVTAEPYPSTSIPFGLLIPEWCQRITVTEGKLINFLVNGVISDYEKQTFVEHALECYDLHYERPRPLTRPPEMPTCIRTITVYRGKITSCGATNLPTPSKAVLTDYTDALLEWMFDQGLENYTEDLIPEWVDHLCVRDKVVMELIRNNKPHTTAEYLAFSRKMSVFNYFYFKREKEIPAFVNIILVKDHIIKILNTTNSSTEKERNDFALEMKKLKDFMYVKPSFVNTAVCPIPLPSFMEWVCVSSDGRIACGPNGLPVNKEEGVNWRKEFIKWKEENQIKNYFHHFIPKWVTRVDVRNHAIYTVTIPTMSDVTVEERTAFFDKMKQFENYNFTTHYA